MTQRWRYIIPHSFFRPGRPATRDYSLDLVFRHLLLYLLPEVHRAQDSSRIDTVCKHRLPRTHRIIVSQIYFTGGFINLHNTVTHGERLGKSNLVPLIRSCHIDGVVINECKYRNLVQQSSHGRQGLPLARLNFCRSMRPPIFAAPICSIR